MIAIPGVKKNAAGNSNGGGLKKLIGIAGLVVILDQVTKLMIVRALALYDEVEVIPGFFSIVHYHNPGGAFGLFAGANSVVRHFFFLFVSVLALGLVFYFYRSTPRRHRFLSAAFAMIFGGAIGNLLDRFRLGMVVDFLDVYVNGWHWPAFNVADSAITIGIGIFVFHLIFGKMPDDLVGKKVR
jgi:signal peptidase II